MFQSNFVAWLRRHGYTRITENASVWEKGDVRYTLKPRSFRKQYRENGRWLNGGTCLYNNARFTAEDKLQRCKVNY
jgi:hypothetical protein